MENASRAGRELNWFPYTRANRRAVEATIEWLYGDSSWLARIRLLWRLRDLDASPRPEEVKP
jgi:hypothetical protein